MMRVLSAFALVLMIGFAGPATAQDWEMAQRDSSHSGFVERGPTSPLKAEWKAQSGDEESSFTTWPVVDGGIVYARSGPGVIAVESTSGKTIWWRRNEEGSTQVAPVVDDNFLYLSVPLGRILALKRETGEQVWRFQAKDSLDASSVMADGRLFVGSADAKVIYSVESSNGSMVWERAVEFEPDSVPAVAGDLVVLSTEDIDSSESQLLAFERNSGEERWRVNQTEGNSSPSILEDKVILGGGDLFAYALNAKTGREVWKSPVEGKFSTRSMPAIAFGDVFLADRIGNIYRLDGKTGKRKWIFSDTEGTFDQSSPVVAGKTLYIGSGAGFLYGVAVDTGKLVWKDRVRGIVLSGAADAERFYFGVKFGDEGLYAYAHDPDPAQTDFGGPREPGTVTTMFKGFALFLVLLLVIVLYAGYRRRRRAA